MGNKKGLVIFPVAVFVFYLALGGCGQSDNGLDVKTRDKDGLTLLHKAARDGNKKLVELLIAKGADINAKNNVGATPLYLAAMNGHREIANFLIAKGANVKAKANNGVTSLHVASYEGHKEVIELLITKGADVKAKENKGWTSLHAAAIMGHKEIANLLIAKGADINAKNNNGMTPLHLAAMENHKETVSLLITKGADVNAKDNDGMTPLDFAKANGHKEVVNFFKTHRARDDIMLSSGAKIIYGYEYAKDKFGVFDIADTAKAYADDGTLVGEARALFGLKDIRGDLWERDRSGRYLLVEEIHYDRNELKKVIYKGQLIFDKWNGLVVREKAISGRKQYNLFFKWPMGR